MAFFSPQLDLQPHFNSQIKLYPEKCPLFFTVIRVLFFRDLKPTNVLLEGDDRPILMDLGSMNHARIEVSGSRQAMSVQVRLNFHT